MEQEPGRHSGSFPSSSTLKPPTPYSQGAIVGRGLHHSLASLQPPLQGRKTVGRKEASREATALPREAAGVKNEEQPHSKAPDRGARGARALSTQLPAETEEPDGGTGESTLITSLIGLCKSKVPAAQTQGAGMGRASCWEGTWGIRRTSLKSYPYPLERSGGPEGPGEPAAPGKRGFPGSCHLPGAEQPLLRCHRRAPLPAVPVPAQLPGPRRHCHFRGHQLEVGARPGKAGLHLQRLEALPVMFPVAALLVFQGAWGPLLATVFLRSQPMPKGLLAFQESITLASALRAPSRTDPPQQRF